MLEMSYGAQQGTPCVHWSHMLLGCLMFGLCEPFSCGMASYCGHAGWQGWPLAKVAASHCLMYWLLSHWWVGLDPSIADHGACEAQGWCQPSNGWGQILAQLSVQSMKSWDWCQPAGGLVTSSTKRLKGALQNGVCQCWCPHGGISSREWLPPVPPSPGES